MENQLADTTSIAKMHKIIRLIEKVLPFLAIAIIAMFCVSVYHSKSGISLWALPLPLTFNFFLTLYMVYYMKKKKYEEMVAITLKKDLGAMTILLATNIVSILMLCLNMAYVIINPFGLKY